jgi:hypothetical protein
MFRKIITEETRRTPGSSKFDDTAGGRAIVEKIFLEIVKSLIVFRVIIFQFLIEKAAKCGFPAFAFNDAVAYRRVAF